MKRLQKGYLIGFILATIGFLTIATIGTLVFIRVIPWERGIGIASYLLALSLFAVMVFFFRAFLDKLQIHRQLEIENLYTLGRKTGFYNLFQFEIRARALRGSPLLAKKKQFIISCTFAPLSVSSNPRHNDEVSAFNFAVSQLLDETFMGNKSKRRLFRKNAYCFHRGEFLLYTFCNSETEVRDLCDELANDIYRLGAEQHVRILVQPFFGIYETSPKDNITFAIDNAQIARSYGEESFEVINFYHDSFRVRASSDDIGELEAALDNQELVVYYQPKFSLKERRFISSEALVRWNSPKYGLLSPASFIERAENAGLISNIDLYVFEHAMMDLSEEIRRGRRALPVSVNFSLYEFFNPNFLSTVTSLMEKHKVPPTMVEVEITETTSQANQFMSISIIKKLKNLGVRVLMDDFGIGYSGIDNLRKIPFDAIKIDKSFTDLIVDDEKTKAIVKLIVELGHMNEIEVIIEGVDNAAQVDILRKMHMDTIQGFYYSRPLPFDQYEKFLKENEFEKKGAAK